MIEITDSLFDDATLTLDLATPEESDTDVLVLNVTADTPDGYAAGAGLYLDRDAAERLAHALFEFALPTRD